MKRTRTTLALTTCTALAAAIAALMNPGVRPAAAQAPTATPPMDMVQLKALYSQKCSACHNLFDPAATNFTRADWQRTVTKMLVRYKASDEISPTEAAEIVDYLATFAPKTAGGKPLNPWDTDQVDVWTTGPSTTRVLNFQSVSPLSSLRQLSSGTSGPAGYWRTTTYDPGPDGIGVKVSQAKPSASRFALLVDEADRPKNIDVRVRFQILNGQVSPSIGLVYGLTDPQDYAVLRCDALHGTLSVLRIAGPVHTPLQVTAINQPEAPASPDTTQPQPSVAEIVSNTSQPLAPGWHTLRLLVHDGQVRGWIDRNKRVSTTDTAYSGGQVGLWAQGDTVALFDDWTIDTYDAPATQGAPSPTMGGG